MQVVFNRRIKTSLVIIVLIVISVLIYAIRSALPWHSVPQRDRLFLGLEACHREEEIDTRVAEMYVRYRQDSNSGDLTRYIQSRINAGIAKPGEYILLSRIAISDANRDPDSHSRMNKYLWSDSIMREGMYRYPSSPTLVLHAAESNETGIARLEALRSVLHKANHIWGDTEINYAIRIRREYIEDIRQIRRDKERGDSEDLAQMRQVEATRAERESMQAEFNKWKEETAREINALK